MSPVLFAKWYGFKRLFGVLEVTT